jgi:hypothetical protein
MIFPKNSAGQWVGSQRPDRYQGWESSVNVSGNIGKEWLDGLVKNLFRINSIAIRKT